MQARVVLPIEAEEEHLSPWPRLLPVVGMLSVVYGLIMAGSAASYIHLILTAPAFRGTGPSLYYTIRDWRVAFAISRGVIGLLMMVAGARFWMRGRWHRLIMVGVQLWLAVWALETLVSMYLFGERAMEYLLSNLIRQVTTAAFPLLILLILREYSKSLPPLSGSGRGALATPPPDRSLGPH
jgi:hypothetical protein